MNGERASSLKAAWSPLANATLAVKEIFAKLEVEKYKHLEVEAAKASVGYDGIYEGYTTTCNKVSEILATRSLARPETSKETRATLVKKANDIIKGLGGSLPPDLSLLMAAHD